MECAALSSCLISHLVGLVRVSDFENAGVNHFAISLFASRPGRNIVKPVVAGLRLWESPERFPSLAVPGVKCRPVFQSAPSPEAEADTARP